MRSAKQPNLQENPVNSLKNLHIPTDAILQGDSLRAKYYIAYGSNLNLEQMARRCPTAKVVGSTTLKNYRLMFRGGSHTAVATVERSCGDEVPVLIWRSYEKRLAVASNHQSTASSTV